MSNAEDNFVHRGGLTLLEMLLAMSIMAIIFAAVVPQFRAVMNGWDTSQAVSETLQNGRVLAEHLRQHLSSASRITSVSDSSTSEGYIEFEDADGDTYRYDIDDNGYVEFGEPDELYALAGPITQFQFACYDPCDLETAITDGNDIRFVTVETTLTNAASLGTDKTFTVSVLLRSIPEPPVPSGITVGETTYTFESDKCKEPDLAQIDATHYLCVYQDKDDDGRAIVLTVDTSTWEITWGDDFEFDNGKGKYPALAQIDSTHFLCAYQGDGDDGMAVVLIVDTSDWTISKGTRYEYNSSKGMTPALAKINDTHFLCAFDSDSTDQLGIAVVLSVNTSNWTISKGWTCRASYRFTFNYPALAQIDDTHFICSFTDGADDGWVTVFTVNPYNWTVTQADYYEFDGLKGKRSDVIAIDDDGRYLIAYQGDGDDGWAVLLRVTVAWWASFSELDSIEFDSQKCLFTDLVRVDGSNYLCSYQGDGDDGWMHLFNIDTNAWEFTGAFEPVEYDNKQGKASALADLGSGYFLCVYQGDGDEGKAVIVTASGQ